MKNKQKTVSKILTLIIILCCAANLSAQSPSKLVEKADSLYASRQYTQSLALYQKLLSQHNYSESMLLKMAFIQEGLGHLSESLYYLNLYYLASDDEQALIKMEALATKYRLQGYQSDQSKKVHLLFKKNYGLITQVLGSIIILLFALMIYQKGKNRKLMPLAIFIVVLLTGMYFHVNFSESTHTGIVNSNSTYLMSGPSAGASVVGIINEGHLLDILDKKDVWLHTKWMNQDVYIKEDQVLAIEL